MGCVDEDLHGQTNPQQKPLLKLSPRAKLSLKLHADQAPVVQTLDSAIHWINHYPLDNSIGFASVYPLDSDLSGGQRYPSFEQLGPGRMSHNFLLKFAKATI